MKTATRTTLTAIALFAAVSLAGCATAAPEGPAQVTPEAEAPATSSDFCAEFEAAGGTGASFGGVALFYPKEDLVAGLEDAVTVLAVTPPDEVSEEWNALKAFYEKALVAANKLDAGQTLGDPALLEESGTLTDEVDTLTDYFFDTCS